MAFVSFCWASILSLQKDIAQLCCLLLHKLILFLTPVGSVHTRAGDPSYGNASICCTDGDVQSVALSSSVDSRFKFALWRGPSWH